MLFLSVYSIPCLLMRQRDCPFVSYFGTRRSTRRGELVNTAKNVVANTWRAFEVWAIVGILYLIVITLLSRLAKRLERRLNRGRE